MTGPPKGRIGRVHRECPVCSSPDLEYDFIVDRYPACSCERCSLLFLNPQPAPNPNRAPVSPSEAGNEIYGVDAANGAARLDLLLRYGRLERGRLLLIGSAGHMEAEARRRGFEVSTLARLEDRDYEEIETGSIDACILYRALETSADPLRSLELVRRFLVPGGSLMVIAPTLDSRTARLFGSSWWEFNSNNLYYFAADTLQSLLLKAGYGDPIITPDDTIVSPHYLLGRLSALPPAFRYRCLARMLSLSPPFLRHRAFRFLHSRTTILVRSKPQSSTRKMSVIVPVYNERRTFSEMMEQLIEKTLEGVDIEIVVVESNSTDGTREEVLRYRDHPRVAVVLEEQPRGKGHAVRRGLEVASGDVVLFQDADLEYDINDYASLVEPILNYERNFVIGSRHILKGRVWKMRRFNDAAGLAAFFNFGHLLFLTLFNVLYWQRLKDPFSMFKVFRRECLFGLEFECDRFDFDFEIVIKLLRKGYRPLELPVNYQARSFREGKKVRAFRDPITWIRALMKFRTSTLYL